MLLHFALAAWMASATGDVVTTYQARTQYPTLLHEQNLTLAPLENHPAWMSAALAAESGAEMWATWKYLKPKHPKVAALVLIAGAVGQGYLTVRNLNHIQQAAHLPVFIPR